MRARRTLEWTRWTVALLLPVSLAPDLRAQCPEELPQVSVLPADFSFGRAVAIDGDAIVVGATPGGGFDGEGSIQFYARSGTSWVPGSSFASSDEKLGQSLAMEGGWAVAGSWPGETARIYRDTGTGWSEHTVLLPDSPSNQCSFSPAVSISGGTLVIGAAGYPGPGGVYRAGGAYVFVLQGGTWVRETVLLADDGTSEDRLGEVVAISGDTVVVGAPWSNKAYVFTRTGSTWSQQARLDPDVPPIGVWFGRSVAIEGDTILVGGRGEDGAGPDAGAVYVFARSGNTWSQQEKLTVDGSFLFGSILALSGGVAAGINLTEGGGPGAVHLFSRVGAEWTPASVLAAPGPPENDYFGGDIDISGARIAVCAPWADSPGANDGRAFVFETLDFQRYCLSTPNSTGAAAMITAFGCNSIASEDLVLVSGPVPDSPGIFYYGSTAFQIPFGNGFRCIAGSVTRSEFVLGSGGVSTWSLDPTVPPHDQITAGSTWRFQHWFRDPMAGGSLFDLSDAVSVTFVP